MLRVLLGGFRNATQAGRAARGYGAHGMKTGWNPALAQHGRRACLVAMCGSRLLAICLRDRLIQGHLGGNGLVAWAWDVVVCEAMGGRSCLCPEVLWAGRGMGFECRMICAQAFVVRPKDYCG